MTSPATRWASFFLVPAIALFEAGAWYGARSILTIYLLQAGNLSHADVGPVMTVASLATMAGTFFAALIAAATGPWMPAIAGALVAALGFFGLGIVPAELASVLLIVASFGHGLVRPAVYGAAARAFDRERENLRNALFFFAWSAVLVAALASPAGAGWAMSSFGARVVFFGLGAIASLALLLAIGGGIVALVTRPRGKTARGTRVRGAHLAIVAAIVLICVVPALYASGAQNHVFGRQGQDLDPEVVGSLLATSSMAGVLVGILGGLISLGLHLAKLRVPALLGSGVGLLAMGAGAVIIAISGESVDGLRAGLVLSGGGEALFLPLLFSRIAGDLPFRLETASIALWLLMTQALSLFSTMSSAAEGTPILVWAGAIGALVVGVALIAVALPLRRAFEPAEADASGDELRKAS